MRSIINSYRAGLNHCLGVLAFLCLATLAQAENYAVEGSDHTHDSVLFRSTAKLEFIEGFSHEIAGSIRVNPDRTSDSISGLFQVDLRTLKTGIEMRDEHMRTRHLQTDQYPFAYFELTSVKGLPQRLTQGVACTCSADGYFYIHGVKRKITPTVHIVDNSTSDKKSIQVHAGFSLNLDEWNIPRPKALFLKLAETIEVEIRFVAHAKEIAPVISLPKWVEP